MILAGSGRVTMACGARCIVAFDTKLLMMGAVLNTKALSDLIEIVSEASRHLLYDTMEKHGTPIRAAIDLSAHVVHG